MPEIDQRLGVLGVLTYKDKFVLTPLGPRDVSADPGRKERIYQPGELEKEWFSLREDSLGFPSGGVKSTEVFKLFGVKLRSILKEQIIREIKEETEPRREDPARGIEIAEHQFRGDLMAVGVIEQIRKGGPDPVDFLVYALYIELTEMQLEVLSLQGARLYSKEELIEQIERTEFTDLVRPATILTIRRSLLGLT